MQGGNPMVFSIISSVVIWGATLVLALRILSESGLSMPNGRYLSPILADKRLGGSHEASAKETAAVFAIAFAFRLVVFFISICAIYMFNDNVDGVSGILEQYMKWDANNYVRIATGGYSYWVEGGAYTTLAFFPLYPWLMRILNVFNNLQITGLLLSFLLYSGACAFLYRLFCIDYGKQTSARTIVYLSVFPHALFFGTIMNESMLLFTMSATLYFIRKHKWPLVGIFGALAALSRMAGILLAVPAAVEWLERYKIIEKLKHKNIKEVWKLFYSKGLWIFLMLAGTGIYLLCNYKVTGDPFKFLEYQRTVWYHEPAYFGTGIQNIVNKLLPSGGSSAVMIFSVWLPSVLSIAFTVAAIIYGIRRNRSMYTAFLTVYFVINVGVDWIISLPRYTTCAVPAFLFLSDFTERHKWTEPIITASMAIGLGVYLVAYLTWKQIL